jgi:hypothetical protein
LPPWSMKKPFSTRPFLLSNFTTRAPAL